MESEKSMSIVGLVLIIGIFGMIVYQTYAIRYARLPAFIVSGLLLGFVILRGYGDLFPIVRRGPQVNFDSGVAGTLKGALIEHPGKKKTGIISIESKLVPKKVIKENRVWRYALLDWLSVGNVTIYVTGDDYQWQTIQGKDCDNWNGAIRFVGNLKGELVRNNEYSLAMELKHQATINRHAITVMEEAEAQLANIASMKMQDMDSASQILEQISKRMKNVRIMARGRGGGEVDALAGEMS